MRKRSKEKQEESASLSDIQPESVNQQPSDDQNVELEVMDIYTRLLHRKVGHFIIVVQCLFKLG